MAKAKLASVWLEACAGCHMSFLDIDERIVGLLEKVELTSTPITDIKVIPEVDVGVIEGALGNEEELHIAKELREKCKILIAWGDCAVFGGINCMRNFMPAEEVLKEGFVNTVSTVNPEGIIPRVDVPALLPQAIPVDRAVKVDVYVPGCPPDADTIYYVFSEILEGRIPTVPTDVMRYDQRRNESMENTKTAVQGKKGKTIVVNPVSRIEGHGKITVNLTEDGMVDSARFHVTQYRGFEVFVRGRDFREMPVITPRICGICPVSHHLASAKACDAILGVTLTPSAAKLREVMHMGQIIQSHALSFFHLSSPDLLFGFDADPAIRNVAGLAQQFPDLAVAGITMRKFGQEIIKTLGGKKIHPWHSIPGGVNRSLFPQERDAMLAALPGHKENLRKALDLVKKYLADNAELAKTFATLETSYMGLVKDGNLEMYDGRIRLRSPRGRITDEFDDTDYVAHIGEHVEDWSYLKFPFYRSLGFPHGSYRVGPLGRLNACDDIATPEASAELAAFRKTTADGMVHYTLYYHYARLIEILYGMERLEELLNDPDVLGSDLRVTGDVTNREGIGVVEAPRGTLIHHYQVDEKGAIEKVNLIVATGHNNYAMNKGVEMVAKEYITGPDVKEGALNRMEHVIRCYDPCLSCSTHAVGKMPLMVEILDSRGELLRMVTKE